MRLLVAAVLLATAVLVLRPGPPRGRALRVARPAGGRASAAWGPSAPGAAAAGQEGAATGLGGRTDGATGAYSALARRSAVLGRYAAGRAVLWVGSRSWGWLRRRAVGLAVTAGGRRRAAAARIRILDTASALAAELRAGQPARSALQRAAAVHDPPVCPEAAAAARLGGDVPLALRADSRRRGSPLLRGLAACWEVGESSGAGLAASVERLVASARAAEEVRSQLEAQLAGPRATARMLATLPLIGVGMGMLLGADPVGWLVGTAAGRGCLAAGLGLTALGMAWTGRIAAGVERRL
ncbi:MAG: type II secretion system F family protein [Candidatus Nanopelagicales bacterium]